MAKRSRALTSVATTNAAAKRTRLSPRSSQRLSSPRQALAAASQATEPVQTFESQLLESQPEAEIAAPTEGSVAGTVATTNARDNDRDDGEDTDNGEDSNNFNSINWDRLKGFIKPLATQRRVKS